ncbi:MAG: type I glyceraldehyde-3-phosphate dehydrogenase, partial [Holophagales bacterium]|nr:type I glyceraldehyde-3-phosphate dehydrogenase [Holophagales bacterium]
MTVRFGVNGLGRIGRALVRLAVVRPELGIVPVAANDLADPAQVARLFAHDTVHGPFPGQVEANGDTLRLGDLELPLGRTARPEEIDWGATGAEIVVEATGRFRRRDLAAGHLVGGARTVVVSATIPDADATFCLGLNEASYDPERHRVISNASCTTNCLAVTLAVLHRAVGVEHALMNTVHCVTNSQNLVDMAHPDPRRARAALGNIIPTTSDAIPSVGWVLPELAGRVEGIAMRVPIVAGSLIDVAVRTARATDRDELAAAFRAAEAGPLAGILGTSDEELVSSDYIG